MSLAVVYSRASLGIAAPQVTVEVHLSNGLPAFNMVGLPETSVRESRDRVRSALLNGNFEFPSKHITVNDYTNHLKGINKYLAILLMLNDQEGTPEELKHADKPFLELKLCNIILNSIPRAMQDMYWSQRGEHFPTKVETLRTKHILIKLE